MSSVFATPNEVPPQANSQMMPNYDSGGQHQQYSQMPYHQQPQQPAVPNPGGPVPTASAAQMNPAPGMSQPFPTANQQPTPAVASYPTPNTAAPTPGAMAPPASIQKLLDENNQYIQLLLEYQSKGRHQQCAEYQRLLHRNLVYLATVADSTNQSPQSNSPSLSLMPGTINSNSATSTSSVAEPTGSVTNR